MTELEKLYKGKNSVSSRWARLGPYYAMFPIDFAFNVVNKYSNPGDKVLDPFSGRGSSIFSSAILGRTGTGIEINPLGWLYSSVKLNPASQNKVVKRLDEIYELRNNYKEELYSDSEFFRICYCDEVLLFLHSARENLKWKKNKTDGTLMSFILIYLHAAIGEGLSNQMKMTKALGIQYSIDWWKKKGLTEPPNINPKELILKKIGWRYKFGTPKNNGSTVKLADSCNFTKKMIVNNNSNYSLLFTSPPYCAVTDYFADQWLRLWLLGGTPFPKYNQGLHKGRFSNQEDYYNLLDTVFGNCSKLLNKKNVVYVRTDCRDFTLNTTKEILRKHFPFHRMEIIEQPIEKKTQTEVLGNKSSKKGEVDIILTV